MTSNKRKILLREAHSLHPTVMIGKMGLTEAVLQAVRESLLNHELIKVKFLDFKQQKHELTDIMSEKADAEKVGMIGNIAILYRRNDDPEKRVYHGIPRE